MILRATEQTATRKRYLTVSEVADYLQLSVETVYMYARTGVIPATKIGKHWRFSMDRLEDWMSRQGAEDDQATGVSVLMVEPDLQIAEAFKTWFSEAGCDVYSVASREQAFPLLAEKDFELIMLDLMDPRLGGLEMLHQIRESKPMAEIVVAASRFDADLMNRALDIGPLTVLRRPVAKDDLVRLVEAHRKPAHDREATTTRMESPRTPVGHSDLAFDRAGAQVRRVESMVDTI